MPRFDKYVDVEVEVDIDVDDFLSECSSSEIKEAIEWLRDNEYLKPTDIVEPSSSISQEMFYNELDKIYNNYYMLTEAEQALIEKIAKRF